MNYSSTQIRKKYLEFFASKDHAIIPSSPVVPENDPTVLFNTAGMQPLVPYLLGQTHPDGKRLANSQKCIRTNDLEEVGDDSHLTFFEMLGNWSLGDYFKKESLSWSYEFLTDSKYLGIDPKKLAVTVFEGDEDAPRDEESASIWKEIGIPENKISYLPKSENWWAAGDTGPCGPDSEIFYWVGEDMFPPEKSNVENDEDNWMEIWNNVFMQFNKLPDGTLELLPAKNVDTGMGLERITTILNGHTSVYDSDIFIDYIRYLQEYFVIENISEEQQTSLRIIVDHIRCSVVMLSDGVNPSNTDQGYVLRKLIRRAIRQGHSIGSNNKAFISEIAEKIIAKLGEAYPNIQNSREQILSELGKEETQFLTTLEKGLKEFEKLLAGFEIAKEKTGKTITEISGQKSFKLYDTYGFPIELTEDLAKEQDMTVDVEGFEKAFEEHKAKSKAGAEKKFKGGLADQGEETTKLHTATHLLLAGLRKVLGDHVFQKGSNITPERLRFDFSHNEKVSREQLDEVEAFVNDAIASNMNVSTEEMLKQEALEKGVVGSFWEKYPDVVTVYTMRSDKDVYSVELCGGPHVETSKGMGRFKIKKEEASSAGVRRIKAVLIDE